MAKNYCSTLEQGTAFEYWVFDVLRPYTTRLDATKHNGNPDLYFKLNNHVVLLECKCFQFREKTGKRPRYIVLRPSQIKALRSMKQGLGGENEIYIICGILFSGYDVMPFTFELEEGLRHAKRWKDAQKRKFIPMDWIIKQLTLRDWMTEKFGVDGANIQMPEFRAYLRR